MIHHTRRLLFATLLVFLTGSDTSAQWTQLPIPSVHGRLGYRAGGALYVLTNGTLCISDDERAHWTYQPFPYDLNNELYGQINDDPPRQMLVAAADTLVFISSYGDEYYIVRGEHSIHSSMEGLRSKIRLGGGPYLLRARGKGGELLLSHDDLYRSTNNGATWELKYKNPRSSYTFDAGAIDERNSDVLFLIEALNNYTIIYKSNDDCATWRTVYAEWGGGRIPDMLVCPDSQVYAGKYFSRDYGETWSRYTMDPDNQYYSEGNKKYVYNDQAHGIFAIHGSRGLFFRDLDDPTFRITTLAAATIAEPYRDGLDLACDTASGKMFAIINDSLYEYDHEHGASKALTQNISAARIAALAAYNREGDSLLLCTPSTFLQSTDAGRTWSFPFEGGVGDHRFALTFSKRTKSLIYLYDLPHSYYVWTIENGKPYYKRIWDATYCRLTYDPHSADTFYGGTNRVWKMTDSIVLSADSSAIVYADTFVDTLSIAELRCIAFDARRKGVMLLGGVDPYDVPFLYRTDDLGLRWERIISIPLRQPPLEIIFDPVVSNRILVADPTGVYISTDDGTSWEYRDPGLGVRKATCIALNPDNPSDVYLGVVSPSRTESIPQARGDGGGVWRSTNGGTTWSKLPIDGLYNYNISHLLVFRNPYRVLVGTPCGAYEYVLDSTISSAPPKQEKSTDIRFQSYPNPCHLSVTIDFELIERSQVRIAIYDVLGRMVASNAERMVLPGQYRIEMNTAGLREGMYTVTLETRTGIHARTIIVARH